MFILLLLNFICSAQHTVYIPYRVGKLFGLSDTAGNIKLKPQYDYIEPVGKDYFKFTMYQSYMDTTYWASGKIEIEKKKRMRTGLLKGTREIIPLSDHRHFSYVKEGLLVGSQESYVSKNSNFYTLNGKKLLKENVEKFRFMKPEGISTASQFAIFTEHFDQTVSILIFDTEKQKLKETLLDHVTNFRLDREAGSEKTMVCSYTDQDRYHHVSIFFDPKTGRYVKVPYQDFHKRLDAGPGIGYGSGSNSGEGERLGIGESPGYEIISDLGERSPGADMQTGKRELPKPPTSFARSKDSTIYYGDQKLVLSADEKVIFTEHYVKTQRVPLIYVKGSKRGLIFSDNERTEAVYDSLRYVKNQFGIFTMSHSFLYLAGIKNEITGEWKFGILNTEGKEQVPLKYEYLVTNLPELEYDTEDKKKPQFTLNQPDNYSKGPDYQMTLYREGIFLAKYGGKYGVINLQDSIIMPFKYDMLWKNGLQFLKTIRSDEDFYVYQVGEKYGVFDFDNNKKITTDTGLIFSDIPVDAIKDYSGIKGFDLYCVAIPGDLFFGYAGSNGVVYYRGK